MDDLSDFDIKEVEAPTASAELRNLAQEQPLAAEHLIRLAELIEKELHLSALAARLKVMPEGEAKERQTRELLALCTTKSPILT